MSLCVNVINRKKLLIDNSIEHITRQIESLKSAGISYELQTKLLRSPAGMSAPKTPSCNFYVYTVYVRRKDYEKACALLSL